MKQNKMKSDENPIHIDFRNPWSWIFLVLAFAFTVYLGWKEGIAIAFAFMSMVVAAYSIGIANRALRLTRATQRPFLNVDQFGVNWSINDGQPTSVKGFIFGLCNTGSFPADQISVIMKVSKKENQQHLFLDSEEIPTICFPSDEIHNRHFRNVDEKEKLEVELKGELRVRIEIEYKNKLTQETHKTNRSYLVQYNPTTSPAPTPLPKEDYWN